MIRTVAVIGLGAMGLPMARRMQVAGFELTVCDRNAAAVASLAAEGARVAATPADCADADFIAVMVATPAQVRDVVLGERGILVGVTARQPASLLAVMSTIPAEALHELAEALHPAGVRVIDP